MKRLKKETLTFEIDSEEEAMREIENYKANQVTDGYTLLKYKNDYKCKKDRRSGETISEIWLGNYEGV